MTMEMKRGAELDLAASDVRPALPRRIVWAAQAVAVCAGLVAGYDFGVQISGEGLGVLLAANAAVFCSMMVDTFADLTLRLKQRQGPSS